MHLWGNGKRRELQGYSHVEGALSALLMKDCEEPFPLERLFVIDASGHDFSAVALAELRARCGLFELAKTGFAAIGDHRKMGDMSWAMGDLDEAERHYSDIEPVFRSYRTEPDYDRLIRLAYVRGDGERFFHWLTAARFGGRYGKNRVSLGRTVVEVKPYLEMLACMWDQRPGISEPDRGTDPRDDWRYFLEDELGLPFDQWEDFRRDPGFRDSATQEKLRAKRLPVVCCRPSLSPEEARKQGDTGRARALLEYVLAVDERINAAQEALERFRESGEEGDLRTFVEAVSGSGVDGISRSVIWAAIGHNSFEASPEVIRRMIQSHSLIQEMAEEKRRGREGRSQVDERKVAG